MSETREFLRGSFEDVSKAQEELLDLLEDPKTEWMMIEKKIIRAFCGFIPEGLRTLLNMIRRFSLQDDPSVRAFLQREVPCYLDYAQREVFRLSGEQPARKGMIEE